MNSVISNITGSVLMRLVLIYGALAAMTTAAIVVGWMVFQSIAANMFVLSQERLPELRNSAEVVAAVDHVRSVLTDILIADTVTGLEQTVERTQVAIADMASAVERIGGERAEALSKDIASVDAALASLKASRRAAFNRADDLSMTVEQNLALATEVSALLDQASDDAYFELVTGGEATIETIDATLTQLIESDFELYQATLQVRAEINLLSGLALSVLRTRDPAMLSILTDLADAAQNQLQQLMPILASEEATRELHSILETSIPELERIFSRAGQGLVPEAILSIRQEIDATLSSAVDDIYFQLVINSDDAKTTNEASIRTLMDEQVSQIKAQAALDSISNLFFSSALQTALARDEIELVALQEALLLNREKLKSSMVGASPEIVEKLEQMLSIASAETGIAATRSAAFIAQENAGIAAKDAAQMVQDIANEIRNFAQTAQNQIDETANGLNSEVALARTRMQQIGMVSLALVLLAPLLIWMMVTRPLNKVTSITERLAQGDLSEIEKIGTRGGEIGRLVKALQVFRNGALERIQLQEDDKRRQAEILETERAAERAQREAEDRARKEKDKQAQLEQEREAKELARNEEIRTGAEAERKALADEQAAVVSELARSLQRLSEGDLSHTIEAKFPETYETLRQDYNAAILNIADLIRRIGDSSGAIDASSAEIASSSLDLSRRTENSAATLEETAAALSELTSSVSSAARGASDASTTVELVKTDAENSRDVMYKAVDAMSEIEESSSKIAKIVEVIDAISFQTNLLALNAGVEAARAGDAGRGFAVVASEVRSLAHRCSEAALQISTLISESTGHVESGVALIDKTSSALETILTGIANVAQNVNEIAHSANEQSTGIGEINTAMDQLDRSTQQNAAMFETTTAASQALTGESCKLSQLVAGFVIPSNASKMVREAEYVDETIALKSGS